MRSIRLESGLRIPLGLSLITALSVVALGCDKDSNSNATAPAPATSASVAAAPSATIAPPPAEDPALLAEDEAANDELRDFHRHHHHGGVTMFISMAIDTLGLDAAKKAQVEKIQSDLSAKMAPARDAEHSLLATIADEIAAGKIDNAKVDAAVAKVGAASATLHTATADALTQLHDTLSPVERATLADKVKAHWDVWREVNVDEKPGSKDKGTHLAKLTKLLDLTPDQVDKISAALAASKPPPAAQADPKPVDAHIDAFTKAFTADKFDPKSLDATATPAAGHLARSGGANEARFYEAVTPVLTADQRTKLAAHLRERLADQHAATEEGVSTLHTPKTK